MLEVWRKLNNSLLWKNTSKKKRWKIPHFRAIFRFSDRHNASALLLNFHRHKIVHAQDTLVFDWLSYDCLNATTFITKNCGPGVINFVTSYQQPCLDYLKVGHLTSHYMPPDSTYKGVCQARSVKERIGVQLHTREVQGFSRNSGNSKNFFLI